MGGSLGAPRSPARRPRPRRPGQSQSARAFSTSCAFSTRRRSPPTSSSSRSFSPSPNATVCAAVKPRCSATNASPLPFEMRGLASSRKYGSDLAMKRRSPNCSIEDRAGARRVGRGRRRRRASSAAARASRAGRRPRDRDALEVGVPAGVLRHVGDVEVVVDVAVEREALLPGRRRSPRGRAASGIGSCSSHSRVAGSTTAAPW